MQTTFERYEKKYLLTPEQYRALRPALDGRVRPDAFGKSTIMNLYFDTPDYRLIRASLDKPVYKEKLRLRAYGAPKADSTVFLEMKKKYKGVVYKRRTEMLLKEFAAWRGGEGQIDSEIRYMLAHYDALAPRMYIGYDRTALYGTQDEGLRVTFDSRILWREDELALSAAWGEPLLAPGERLMEIKIAGAMPLWLAHLLGEVKAYPTSFSKYGNAYLAARRAKGGVRYA